MSELYVLVWFPAGKAREKDQEPEVCRTLFTSKKEASRVGRAEAEPGDIWAVHYIGEMVNVGTRNVS